MEPTATHSELVSALRDVLTEGEQSEKAMLIKRIPFICQDIITIKNNIWWIMMIGGFFGSSLLIGVGLIALKTLGG